MDSGDGTHGANEPPVTPTPADGGAAHPELFIHDADAVQEASRPHAAPGAHVDDAGPSTGQLARAAFGTAFAPVAPVQTPRTPPPPPPDPQIVRRRTVRASIGWLLAAVLVIGAGFATVGALNRDVFSAGGFVQQYLQALERGDAVEALGMPGVQASAPSESQIENIEPSTTSKALLRGSALRGPSNIKIVSDTRGPDGVHTVRASYTLAGAPGSSTFEVQNTGAIAGVFPTWRFFTSPLAVLNVTVQHAALFEINSLSLDSRASAALGTKPEFSNTGSYFAFSPGLYSVSHDSNYLTAEKTTLRLTESGPHDLTVDAQPTPAFAEAVQSELNSYLDTCTTQQVLQPSDCPFGVEIDDRVVSDPVWSMVSYPVVTLAPGETTFAMPATDGLAHISVEVKSLFDGEVEERSSDEAFVLSLTVNITEQGSLDIRIG